MPRPRKAKISDEFRLQMTLQYHIIDARISSHDGVTQLKHEVYGWMDPETYYGLQKLHDLMPLLQEFMHGGYRAKQALWGLTVSGEVLGTGFSVPVGMALAGAEVLNLAEELLRQPLDPKMLLLRLYALVGPWGDVIQIIDTLYGVGNFLAGLIPGPQGGFFGSGYGPGAPPHPGGQPR